MKGFLLHDESRRRILLAAPGAAILLAGCANAVAVPAEVPNSKAKGDEDVSPPEDLMREHGVLNRVLLIYDEGVRRLDAQQPVVMEVVAGAADIIRRFIEQYHEKLEEDFLFPRFDKANKLVDLVATLRKQHEAGRSLTESILRLANPASAAGERRHLAETMRLFIRMYRPHEAREDTVLFPAFRTIVSAKEFDELGEQFEDKEHDLFGKEGFGGVVAQVAKLEQTMGIYDLSQFTPPGGASTPPLASPAGAR